mmetsp:Transcript_42402/g.72137  ORF Transcript_42402/g.72137 Transcript_42402/m.72137 type:complete len:85 (+) Transcript_42402:518-772(+)
MRLPVQSDYKSTATDQWTLKTKQEIAQELEQLSWQVWTKWYTRTTMHLTLRTCHCLRGVALRSALLAAGPDRLRVPLELHLPLP